MIRLLITFIVVTLCHAALAADIPDLKLTPGVTVKISLHELCTKKWGHDKRAVTTAMKREVFASYKLSGNTDPSCKSERHFEIDHLISRELGGADDIKNLWPQCYSGPWNAVMKDRVENRLHKEVCSSNLTLEDAQSQITSDWRVPYRRYFSQK